MKENTVCPYCSTSLPKVPTRKTKCKACGQFMFVKTEPETRRRVVVTKQQADQIESRWADQANLTERNAFIKQYNLTEQEYESALIHFGSEPEARFGLLIAQAENHEHTDRLRASLYHTLARMAAEAGKPFKEFQRLSMLRELLVLQSKKFVDRVEIHSLPDVCDACRKQNKRILLLSKALNEQPIPCDGCMCTSGDIVGFCMCMYLPVID